MNKKEAQDQATLTQLTQPDLSWHLSENIQHIGPLWAQHDVGKNTVKREA